MVDLELTIKAHVDGALTTKNGNPIIKVIQIHYIAPSCPGIPRLIDTPSLLKALKRWMDQYTPKT